MEFEKALSKRDKKIKVNTLVRVLISALLLSSSIIYFISPLANLNNFHYTTDGYLIDEDVLSYCSLNRKDSLYLIDKNNISSKLSSLSFIDEAEVNINIKGLTISLHEDAPSAIYQDSFVDKNGDYYSEEFLTNSLNQTYLENNKSKLAILINHDLDSSCSDYFNIARGVNRLDNKYIYYLEPLSNENSWAFYYNIFEETFLKVVFSYCSTFSLDTYTSKLSIAEDELSLLYQNISIKQNISYNETLNFNYYTVKLSLKGDKALKYYSY